MSENKVFMDTNVFTEIVDSIGTSASNCVLSDSVLNNKEIWDNLAVGKKMTKLLKDVVKSSKAYNAESAVVLPTAFIKLRDSMIRVDKVASESLEVDVDKN
ncbi:hypothetical protein D6853_08900 [Butyrivibrio sp. X503]|uniref:hypothetical protein n=1 Tax=Butyrivibrio sp. X503 TaxID=2364878 RepID=UPI000EAA4E5D|nr:hypothetical protein [Butyrivibrio sp. X503]RKM55663.1 hypothetical protein D6853_08900 [Butyrivibrio sp. X503]